MSRRMHLQVVRPSPTTVLYTVSTAPPRHSLSAHILHHVLLFVRILLGAGMLLALYERAFSSFDADLHTITAAPGLASLYENVQVQLALLSPALVQYNDEWLLYVTDRTRHQAMLTLVPLAAVGLFLLTQRYHVEESLLVLHSLGIQTRTLSSSYLLPATVHFIPTSSIRDIFIHEAFRGFEVRYYLGVVVEREREVVVVFPKSLPGRKVLEEVWRGARGCLFGPVAAVEGQGKKHAGADAG